MVKFIVIEKSLVYNSVCIIPDLILLQRNCSFPGGPISMVFMDATNYNLHLLIQ